MKDGNNIINIKNKYSYEILIIWNKIREVKVENQTIFWNKLIEEKN